MNQLETEETHLLTSYKRDEWKPIAEVVRERARYQQYATAQANANGSVRIDLPAADYARLRERSRETGLTEESIIALLVQGYVSGQVVLPG